MGNARSAPPLTAPRYRGRVRRSLLLAGLAALIVLPAASAAPSSGVHGYAMLLNARPVCVEGRPCERPAIGLLLRFSREGRVVGRGLTDRAGYYTVQLPRGVYTVSIAPAYMGRGIAPRTVRVPAGTRTRVDFAIDMRLQ